MSVKKLKDIFDIPSGRHIIIFVDSFGKEHHVSLVMDPAQDAKNKKTLDAEIKAFAKREKQTEKYILAHGGKEVLETQKVKHDD